MSGQQDVQGTLRDMWETRPARPRDDRKIAGVSAAIARRYDIDPVLVRIAFVVAAFYGGIGFLLYLAGWVLLPDAGPAPDAAGRAARRSEPHPVLLVLLIIVAVGTGSAVLFGGSPGGLVTLAVAAGLLFMLHRTRGDRGISAAAAATTTHPGTTSAPAQTAPDASTPAGAATADAPTVQTAADADAAVVPGPGPYGRSEPPAWDPLGAAPFAWDLPEPASPPEPPEPPRPGAWLTPLTFGLALLAGGIAGAVVLSAGGLGGLRVVFGVMLAVLGLGLLVGAFLHRGRGLIVLAIPMIVLTYALTSAQLQDWQGVEDLTAAPTTAAAVAPTYERTAGDIRLDLSKLDLSVPTGTDPLPAATGPVSTTVAVDVGSIYVQVPPDADVTVHCDVSLGDMDCLGRQLDGPGLETTVTDLGRDGVSSGRPLMLDVSAGLGDVEVHRG